MIIAVVAGLSIVLSKLHISGIQVVYLLGFFDSELCSAIANRGRNHDNTPTF